ncbi:hypothetical protein ARHIZOSPH14_20750 [Agromyces rhizosphaerae]|uniref:Uncharacterized protein n=1 Tax=Agromyces rhizosphaerae TaxID=88374 RepID=A0A9W6D1K3_9MICO|nr:hypothetical protein [Agromyces rhizosphaerae]GLI27833.1 hypothetical protein ARHIZOSPH14_20750 [Agromyces rhizosphaerae]
MPQRMPGTTLVAVIGLGAGILNLLFVVLLNLGVVVAVEPGSPVAASPVPTQADETRDLWIILGVTASSMVAGVASIAASVGLLVGGGRVPRVALTIAQALALAATLVLIVRVPTWVPPYVLAVAALAVLALLWLPPRAPARPQPAAA